VVPLHATIGEFAAQGYTQVESFCPRCHVTKADHLATRISMGLTQLSERLRLHGVRWPAALDTQSEGRRRNGALP
jgi:hypothetical protein